MILKRINIKNFRLLNNVSLNLDESLTLIVGRNNSGKTSLFSLLSSVLSTDNLKKLSFNDFSFSSIEHLKNYCGIEIVTPKISIELIVDYSKEIDSYPSALQPFVIDLDEKITSIKILLEFSIENATLEIEFLKELAELNKNQSQNLQYDLLIKKYFNWVIYAIDPTNDSNKCKVLVSDLSNLIKCGFVSAQRFLQDEETIKTNSIGEVIREIVTSLPDSDAIKSSFENSLQQVQLDLSNISNQFVNEVKDNIENFGSDDIENITAEMLIDSDNIMPFLRMSYLQGNGIHFPEHFNGLGRRNLLLICMKLIASAYSYKHSETRSPVNLIFIEEPEAFFHPQMQEVFIKNLKGFKKELDEKILTGIDGWQVQFIISTHSSHIANQEDFEKIRYFKRNQIEQNITQIKDLSEFNDQQNIKFLRQYLTLTRCDLFFADKAILYEGTSERLMLPKILQVYKSQNPKSKLNSQYVTLVEVGGAHAHKFFDFLKWLGLPALIITDLDSVKANLSPFSELESDSNEENQKRKKCMVSEGTHTSNSCLNSWFKGGNDKGISIKQLLQVSKKNKKQDRLLITYQVYENKGDLPICGRSFEEAFILANLDMFEDIKNASNKEDKLWQTYGQLSSDKKTAFAFKYAFTETEWNIPRYIKEGLDALEKEIP